MGSLRDKLFPSPVIQFQEEQEEREAQEAARVRLKPWVVNQQFDRTLAWIRKEIINNEPTPESGDPMFSSGIVRGLRTVESHLIRLKADATGEIDA